jgi:opacity protein-like surface antigen
LRFDNDAEPSISQRMVVAAAGRQFARDWSLRLAAGAILGGTMSVLDQDHDVGTGWLATASASRRWLFGGRLFASASFTIGVSSTTTTDPGTGMDIDLSAGDARIGALFGVRLWDRFSPYLLGRYFGGPVNWTMGGQDTVGTDQYHYQVGAGASVQLPAGLSALVDASLLGERSLSLGVSYTL